jgi:hypothetical protein
MKRREFLIARQKQYSLERPEVRRAWVAKNKEKIRQYVRNRYRTNPQAVLAKQREAYAKDQLKFLARQRRWRLANPDYNARHHKKYYAANKEAIIAKVTEWIEKNPERARATRVASCRRRRLDPKVRLDMNMARAIHSEIRGQKAGKRWSEFTGYEIDELKRYLESKFQPGMSWDNYGLRGWHVDHAVPLCKFSYQTPYDLQFRQCWCLENLQPMWWRENVSKNGFIRQPTQIPLGL